jgi:hypothetical protein
VGRLRYLHRACRYPALRDSDFITHRLHKREIRLDESQKVGALTGNLRQKEEFMKIGYVRVSKQEQNEELQIDALKEAGCDKWFVDKSYWQVGVVGPRSSP